MDLPRGGGPRPRRVQPLPGGDLPDDGVRLARRHGAEDDDPAGGRGGARCRAAGHRRGVQVRRQPVPWAYRVFFRQIGIDPDARRTPAEAAAVERMLAGTFASRNLVDDALTIAVVETGVPVVAFDADRLDGEPGLRLAVAGERLGGEGRDLRGGEIVLADERRPLAILFGEISERRGVGPDTERMLLVAIRVKGVPDVSVEEALWTASETLRSTS